MRIPRPTLCRSGHGRQGSRARRDRRSRRHAAIHERRRRAARGALRVPGVDPRGGARDDHATRRPPDHGRASARRSSARRSTTQAKREGKTAALLEQQRPNVFQMSVGQHPAGRRRAGRAPLHGAPGADRTASTSSSTRPWSGPRYNGAPGQESHSARALDLDAVSQREGSRAAHTFEPRGRPGIAGAAAARSPRRATRSRRSGERTREAPRSSSRRDASPRTTATSSCVPARRRGDRVGRAAVRGTRRELLPRDGRSRRCACRRRQIPPREYVFIVDVSGSMHGFPLDTTQGAACATCSASCVRATRSTCCCSRATRRCCRRSRCPRPRRTSRRHCGSIDAQSRRRRHRAAARVAAGDRAAERPPIASRIFVIVTDGYVAVEREVFDLIREQPVAGEPVRVRHRLRGEPLPDRGHRARRAGRAVRGARAVAGRRAGAAAFRRIIESPVMTRVSVRFEGFDVYDVTPLGFPTCSRAARSSCSASGAARRHGAAAGRRADDTGLHRDAPRGRSARRAQAQRAALSLGARTHRRADGPGRAHGRRRQRKAILELGLKYNLLTQYTSFIAVDRSCASRIQTHADGRSTAAAAEGRIGSCRRRSPAFRATPEPSMWRCSRSLAVGWASRSWRRYRRPAARARRRADVPAALCARAPPPRRPRSRRCPACLRSCSSLSGRSGPGVCDRFLDGSDEPWGMRGYRCARSADVARSSGFTGPRRARAARRTSAALCAAVVTRGVAAGAAARRVRIARRHRRVDGGAQRSQHRCCRT